MISKTTFVGIFIVTFWILAFILISHNHFYNNNNHSLHLVNRKANPSKELFDFTPFYKYHHHYNHDHHEDSNSDKNQGFDFRFGVQKRIVPTGPNPLHH